MMKIIQFLIYFQVYSNNFTQFRFRSYQTFLNDGKYASINELPISFETRKELFEIQNINRRVIFYGFSQEILQESAKTIALENKWLFKEINGQEIMLQFVQQKKEITYLFKNAYEDSLINKNYCLLVINEIDHIFQLNNKYSPDVVQSVKQWFHNQILQYTVKTTDRMSGNLIVVMTTNQPYLLDPLFIQGILNKGVFFDFPDLKMNKVLLSNSILELESSSKIQFDRLEAQDDLPFIQNNYNEKLPIKDTQQSQQIQKDNELINRINSVFEGEGQQMLLQTKNKISLKNKNKLNQFQQFQQNQFQQKNQVEPMQMEGQEPFSQEMAKCVKFQQLILQQGPEQQQQQIPNTQIIQSHDLQIIIEKRMNKRVKYNPSLLGEDNVLILTGKRVCIIFDQDFEFFLADRTQQIKSEDDQEIEKVGFIEIDMQNVLRQTILQHQALFNNNNKMSYINQQIYEITFNNLKQAFINYRPVTNLHLANQIIQFKNHYHNFFQSQVFNDQIINLPVSTIDPQFVQYQQSQVERPQNIYNGNYHDEKNQKLLDQKNLFKQKLDQIQPSLYLKDINDLDTQQIIQPEQNIQDQLKDGQLQFEIGLIKQKNFQFQQKIDILTQQINKMNQLQQAILQQIQNNNQKFNQNIQPQIKQPIPFEQTDFLQQIPQIPQVVKIHQGLPNSDSFLYEAQKFRNDIEQRSTQSILHI